jgi:hypothetical protein
MIKNKIKIIPINVTPDYDGRNGRIHNEMSAFYKQTLIFTQTHHSSRNLIVNLNLLDFNDNIICQSVKYTKIKTSFFDSRNMTTALKNPRFFHIFCYFDENKNDKTNLLMDLGSLKLLKNHIRKYTCQNGKIIDDDKSDYLNINYYLVNNETSSLDNFFEESKLYKTEEFNDGYPNNCIICKKKTSEASYGYNNTFMGLGNSFCLGCHIRYSKSDKSWQCCKLKKDPRSETIMLCSNNLSNSNNYLCDSLSHVENYKLHINNSTNDNNTEYDGVFTKKKIHVSPIEL